jgi:hypothetical protein
MGRHNTSRSDNIRATVYGTSLGCWCTSLSAQGVADGPARSPWNGRCQDTKFGLRCRVPSGMGCAHLHKTVHKCSRSSSTGGSMDRTREGNQNSLDNTKLVAVCHPSSTIRGMIFGQIHTRPEPVWAWPESPGAEPVWLEVQWEVQ